MEAREATNGTCRASHQTALNLGPHNKLDALGERKTKEMAEWHAIRKNGCYCLGVGAESFTNEMVAILQQF
jgi:hypothetical protein